MKIPARSKLRCVWILGLLVGVSFSRIAYAEPNAARNGEYQSAIKPLLERYCQDCHSGKSAEAEVDLAAFQKSADVRKDLKTWLKVRRMLGSAQMPPKEAPQPGEKEASRMKNWVRDFLAEEAKANAGDPGPVLLRRLSNAEYTYTIRDLTDVETLDPTREFPVDGAAGEGFTNTGSGQGMSPALLQKYLDAAKAVSKHIVFLPDGIRFSPHTTRRDHTDELLARIQAFYRQFTEDGGGQAINLQGIKFNTNQGGRLPLTKYLAAMLAERERLKREPSAIRAVARERSLNAKYLAILWKALSEESRGSSFYLQSLRSNWQAAQPEDAGLLEAEIAALQNQLWKFNSIGHIGREGGAKAWMEPVSPLAAKRELRVPLQTTTANSDVTVYLAVGDLGDGSEGDDVVLERPRIEFPAGSSGTAKSPIMLRDACRLIGKVTQLQTDELKRTEDYLTAVADLRDLSKTVAEVAKARNLNADLLANWMKWAGFRKTGKPVIAGHFAKKLTKVQGFDAINGWGGNEGTSLLTNRSDQPISFLTLTVPARGVAVHPWPKQEAAVAWRSPVETRVEIEGFVADADNKCGNGAAWRLELLTETGPSVLASGTIDNGGRSEFHIKNTVDVQPGDVVFLVVNARDGNHVCDTTHISWTIRETAGAKRVWVLAKDIVDKISAGNPLPDSLGHKDVWHFFNPASQKKKGSTIPANSALANWRAAVIHEVSSEIQRQHASRVQSAMLTKHENSLSEADQNLRQQLRDWKGPLDWLGIESDRMAGDWEYALDPKLFGKRLDGSSLPEADLCIKAPQVLAIRLPADLAKDGVFVTSARLDEKTGQSGSVQIQAQTSKPKGKELPLAAPILIGKSELVRRRVEKAMREFRDLFPPALCYARIVPVDEVVTLTLFYREDDQLKRLMLSDEQAARLDRLWDELFFVSQEPLKLVVAFEQISEFATQDRPDLVKAFAPMQQPIEERAEAFRRRRIASEPAHVAGVLTLADRAWRRPLTNLEKESLQGFYRSLRENRTSHEEAIRLMLARVLTSPAFLYKLETQPAGKEPLPVSDLELATRLSYFLWSSLPDETLRRLAQKDVLHEEKNLREETRRMLKHTRTRRLAVQFACQWLHLRDFDKTTEKNEALYPEFAQVKRDMSEETIRFFEEMFQENGSILDLLTADYAFLNERLAKHYGVPGVRGSKWRRVNGIKAQGRGGVLGMASFLASQSGASRTSPILRGNWIYETLLGERLPRPPANVPVLPEQVPPGLTARQLIEHHSSQPACAKCHSRIDPYGFSLEQFDAIGRTRPKKVDARTKLPHGKMIEGLDGLRSYLSVDRKDDVVEQFCRKLLGFALGRELELSDEPLLKEMKSKLEANDYQFHAAVETIVTSPQFQRIRGRDMPTE